MGDDQTTTAEPPAPVILAGGRGTRPSPMTSALPKPLMPLVDGPVIDVLLRQLSLQGWRRATLAVGHMGDLIRAYCGDGARYGLALEYIQEDEPLGTVGPLGLLPPERLARSVLVMNGDLLTSLPFADLVAAHERGGSIATIAVVRRPIRLEFGLLRVSTEGDPELPRVTSYREKPEIPAILSMGVYVFRSEVLQYIDAGRPLDLPDLIDRLLADGRQVSAYPYEGYWLDIGGQSDYQTAIDDFQRFRAELFPTIAVAS